jgi:hypothetical protein
MAVITPVLSSVDPGEIVCAVERFAETAEKGSSAHLPTSCLTG